MSKHNIALITEVKFTSIPMTSAPRVERVDDLVVDSQGLDPPTEKWLQAAREAADTDGIRENAYAERLQMCISCCTLMCMFPMVPNMYRVSHSRYVSERVSPSYSTTGIGPFWVGCIAWPRDRATDGPRGGDPCPGLIRTLRYNRIAYRTVCICIHCIVLYS